VISQIIVAIVAIVALEAIAILAWRWRRLGGSQERISPPPKRILFPFVGNKVSTSVLDAALRLARAESATLVPVYVATVPLQLNLDVPIPAACSVAMPLLEVIEHRAAGMGVVVDSRIETGRTPRHALRRLFDHERFDRLVIPASGSRAGFSPADIAWLLENAPGEILVVRPAEPDRTIRPPSHTNGGTRERTPSLLSH
jgi:nucleotide-binding universal stress UspA family protein